MKSSSDTPIEHSENNLLLVSEMRLDQECSCLIFDKDTIPKKFHAIRTEWAHNQLHMVCGFSTLAVLTFVERWTRALQVVSHFQTTRIA